MPTSPIVDVVVGLLFFFTALSLLSSAIQERIASALDLRSRGLEAWIVKNLGADTAKRFYEHPIIAGLGGTDASYIPSQAFAAALFETCQITPQPAVAAGATVDPLNQEAVTAAIRKVLASLPDVPACAALRTHFEHAQSNMTRARQNVEAWFDSAMERLSGSYKRRIHWNLLIITALLTLAMDGDVLRVARVLYRDQAVRAAVVEQARVAASGPEATTFSPQRFAARVPLPLAWQGDRPPSPGARPLWYVYKLLGLLLTIAGVSLGAPFWFDLLTRVVNLRAAGAKPPTTAAA